MMTTYATNNFWLLFNYKIINSNWQSTGSPDRVYSTSSGRANMLCCSYGNCLILLWNVKSLLWKWSLKVRKAGEVQKTWSLRTHSTLHGRRELLSNLLGDIVLWQKGEAICWLVFLHLRTQLLAHKQCHL